MGLFWRDEQTRSRFEDSLEAFRTWWLGLDPVTRASNEGRLKVMGQLAGEMMAATGDGFGEHLWSMMLEAVTSFTVSGHEAPWYLARVRRVFPEVWPLIEPHLSDTLRGKVAAEVAELAEEDTQP